MEREPPDTFPHGSTAQILLFLVVITLIFRSPDYITIFLGSQSTIFHLNPYNVGDDTACGGSGNDYLRGDENNDLLDGCEGNDTLLGGKENDTIFGGVGDDFLSGDLGDDFLIGGSGRDRFLIGADSGIDTILDFEPGQDAIALSRGFTSSQLSITQANNDSLIRLTATGQILATLSNVSVTNSIFDIRLDSLTNI